MDELKCIEDDMTCKAVQYSQRQSGMTIDYTFISIIKKIRRKHFCTIGSCSAVIADHQSCQYTRREILNEEQEPEPKINIVKDNYLNGFVEIKLMDMASKDVKKIRSKFKDRFYFTFKTIRETINVSCDAVTIYKRIVKAEKKSNFYHQILFFNEKPAILAIVVQPRETREKFGLSDDAILKRWNEFVDALDSNAISK